MGIDLYAQPNFDESYDAFEEYASEDKALGNEHGSNYDLKYSMNPWYFRSSYNASGVFGIINIPSFEEYHDDDCMIAGDALRRFLKDVACAGLPEVDKELVARRRGKVDDNENKLELWNRSYRARYWALVSFLARAVRTGQSVYCSY